MQSPHLLWSRLTGVVECIRRYKINDRAKDTKDETGVEPEDVDGHKGDQHDAVLAPSELLLDLCTDEAGIGGVVRVAQAQTQAQTQTQA